MAVFGELAIGVAAGFIVDGIRIPLALITNEVRRRDQIGRALNERPSGKQARLEAQVENISGDLARVIGNSEGKLTTAVAEFMRELRKTSLPQAIAHAALCGSTAEKILPAFEAFSERFPSLPFEPAQFLEAYYQASLSRFESVNDKAMLEIIRAQHAELTGQLKALTSSLTKMTELTLDLATLRETRIKIARQIEASHRFITVETLRGARRYALRSLAIPGRLLPLDPAHIHSAKAPLEGETISYISFRRSFQKHVILGDPGGGKSTLTQLISYDLANSIGLEAANPDRKDFDPRDLKIPLRIILRSFEAKKARDASYNFLDHLKDELSLALDDDKLLTTQFLLWVLSAGEAVVIFDGLDEVLDVGSRRSIVGYIEQFSEHYASCPVLITSRLVGYRDAPLCHEFTPMALARFNLEEVEKYSEKAIAAISNLRQSPARTQAEEFVRQSSNVGRDLRENPLMLGLMVQIFVARGDVPSHRPEVYKECATLMFEKWDGRREIEVDIPSKDVELLDVFGYVASRTFGNAESEEGVSKAWLVNELRRHFEGWYVDKASARRAASSLVDFLTGRAWVMSEVGQEVFKFTHRTFLEYFFARSLISESASVSDLLVLELIPRILNSEWSVISHLALHMAVFRDGGKARQVAISIKKCLVEIDVPSHQEIAFLEFLAEALDYLLIPEALYIELVGTVARRAVNIGGKENFVASSIISVLFETANHRLILVKKVIAEILRSEIGGGVSPGYLNAVHVLGSRRPEGIKDMHHNRQRLPPSLAWQNLQELRSELHQKVLAEARKNVSIARAYIYAFDDHTTELYRYHTNALLASSPLLVCPAGVEQVLSTALQAVCSRLLHAGLSRSSLQSEQLADSFDLIHAVANDLSIEGFDKFQLGKIPGSRASQLIGRDLDSAFRSLWHLTQHRRNRNTFKDESVDALACILLVSDQLTPKRYPGRGRYGAAEPPFAPLAAIRRVCETLRPNRFEAFFADWLSQAKDRYKNDDDELADEDASTAEPP